MPGPYPSKVDSLTFIIRHPDDFDVDDVPTIPDLRLFSSGGGSELLEWNLERSCVKVCNHILYQLVVEFMQLPADNQLSGWCNMVCRSQPGIHIPRIGLRRWHSPPVISGQRYSHTLSSL